MIGIIIAGHGKIATGILSAIKLIFGETEKFSTIDFDEGMSSEDFREKLEEEIKKFSDDEVLILTDIAGGTPFKEAVLLSLNNKNIKVISGMNLPMVLGVIDERDNLKIDSLFADAIETGKNQIIGYEEKEKKSNDTESEDGI